MDVRHRSAIGPDSSPLRNSQIRTTVSATYLQGPVAGHGAGPGSSGPPS